MSFDDAVAAAHVTVSEPTGCDLILYGQPGSGVESVAVWGPPVVDTITVYRPGIRTISGIGVGSTRADVLATYTDAEPRVAWYRGSGVPTTLVITSASGNVIEFSFTEDGTDTVSRMTLSTSLATIDGHAVC
jgi:hypothetical protein